MDILVHNAMSEEQKWILIICLSLTRLVKLISAWYARLLYVAQSLDTLDRHRFTLWGLGTLFELWTYWFCLSDMLLEKLAGETKAFRENPDIVP